MTDTPPGPDPKPPGGVVYGIRDAAAVLMRYRRKVARQWRGRGERRQWRWMLDGRPVTLQRLEDEAERYERLRYRHTPRTQTRAGQAEHG